MNPYLLGAILATAALVVMAVGVLWLSHVGIQQAAETPERRGR